MKLTNDGAHKLFKAFKDLADEYNNTGFTDLSDGLIESYLITVRGVLDLFRFLNSREPCKATISALADASRLEARLYYLKHYQRKETDKERAGFIGVELTKARGN